MDVYLEENFFSCKFNMITLNEVIKDFKIRPHSISKFLEDFIILIIIQNKVDHN